MARPVVTITTSQHLMNVVKDTALTNATPLQVDQSLGLLFARKANGERLINIPLKRQDVWAAVEIVNAVNQRAKNNLPPSSVDVDRLYAALAPAS